VNSIYRRSRTETVKHNPKTVVGTCKGQMSGEIFILVDWYKNRLYFCVANIRRLKYDHNSNIKCDEVGKIQDREVNNL
jgi:hypothetical protein